MTDEDDDKRPLIRITFDVRVHDVRAFVRAARKHAIEVDNWPEDHAKEALKATELGDCLRMLMDPGVSYEGCQILDSETEVL